MTQLIEQRKIPYLIVLLTILVSDDTLFFGTPGNDIFISIKYFVLFGLYVWLLTSYHHTFSNDSLPKLVCGMMCACVLLSGIVNADLRLGVFYKCFILMLSLLIASKLKYEEYSNAFTFIIVIVATISVVFMSVATISFSLLSFAPVFTNVAEQPFYNFFVFLVPTHVEHLRNYGFFREPGVFQMYLIMALVFNTYNNNGFNLKYFIILSIALVFTYSTTGFIAYGIYLILFYLQSKKNKISKKTLRKITLLLIVGVTFLMLKTDLLSSEGMVFDKFENTNRGTTVARLASYTSTYDLWRESPVFGNGLTKTEDKFKEITYAFYGQESTNTNTLMSELATYGTLFFILMCLGLILFAKKTGLTFLDKSLLFLIFIILSTGEKLTFSPFFYIICLYGWTIRPYQYKLKKSKVQ